MEAGVTINSASHRLYVLSLLFLTLVLHASYSAILTTFLTTSDIEIPFNNINEFQTKGREYTLGIPVGTYLEHVMRVNISVIR